MNGELHKPPEYSKNIYKWYNKAQIDYANHYLQMYISYNAWYGQVTGTSNSREAIAILKKRFIIWDDYSNDRTMLSLKIYMERLCKLTVEKPLGSFTLWDGVIKNKNDWRSLIEFWYQVRCLLVHGSEVPPKYVWLAYETLDVFMGEIVDRMQACFTKKDLYRLKEVSSLARIEGENVNKFQALKRKLQEKYIESPDIWQVDMQRVSN